jgi:Asp-tRNA(Asn)/Glu-tRNA(Gln) amidotransferase A subunit family amidase
MRTNNQKCRRITARSILAGLLLITCFSGCAIPQGHSARSSHNRAFIVYWPGKENKAMRLAVKDNIDMKGVVTTAGSEYLAKTSQAASRDAKCLAIARERNVQIVGKTNLSEFAVAPSGLNEYYGTPKNPFSKLRRFIPGGSSSGSAVAAADGLADVAFATDTAGSIRVPAACCGIVGLKTTFGLVSLKGVLPIEPKHLDTVGPMAKDVDHVVQGMDLLRSGFAAQYRRAVAAKPLARDIRIGRLYLSGTDPKIDKAVDDALAQRSKAYGYFAGSRFGTRDGQEITDEIALNPAHLERRSTEETLSTLVHEMTHLEQHHFGKPSRSGYRNRRWATLMKAVGLIPSDTGAPGENRPANR